MSEQNKEWKSYVLQTCDDDDDCNVCRFLAGDRTTEVLLHVIKVLDKELEKSTAIRVRLSSMLMEEIGGY